MPFKISNMIKLRTYLNLGQLVDDTGFVLHFKNRFWLK